MANIASRKHKGKRAQNTHSHTQSKTLGLLPTTKIIIPSGLVNYIRALYCKDFTVGFPSSSIMSSPPMSEVVSYCFSLSLLLVKNRFSLNRPLGRFSHRVAMSVCLSFCPSHPRNHASRRIRDLWSKGVSLILAYL